MSLSLIASLKHGEQQIVSAVLGDGVGTQGWSKAPLTLQEEKRQKAEQSQKAPEASASSSSSMSPLLAAAAEKRAIPGKNKERRKATREERAAERERALLKKQRAEHWQGTKRWAIFCGQQGPHQRTPLLTHFAKQCAKIGTCVQEPVEMAPAGSSRPGVIVRPGAAGEGQPGAQQR